jgi:selenide,water dikinase
MTADIRSTQYASGGGCAGKIPPGELEETVAALERGGQPGRAQDGPAIIVR